MERVTFLVERTGERIPCLLNPEHLEVRRSAGLVRRRSVGGAIIGNPRTDDPLIATGGGTTDYELRLLFDVDLLAVPAPAAAIELPPTETTTSAQEESQDGSAGALEQADTTSTAETAGAEGTSEGTADGPDQGLPTTPLAPTASPSSVDVRTLTQPLWALAENGEPLNGRLAPQRVRFIWGRSWNVPGVILAVAERHEQFDSQGVPKRSWLSLLLRRVEEEVDAGSSPPAPTSPQFEINSGNSGAEGSGDDSIVIPVDEEGMVLTPLHMIAAERYGDPHYDRAIAEYNGLDDLLELEEGQPIRLPPAISVTVEI